MDCLIALTLWAGKSSFLFHALGAYLCYAALLKGIFSLLSSFAVKYYFDWMGFLDCVAGLFLLLFLFGITPPFLNEVRMVYSFKALYVTIRSVFNF